MPTTVDAFVHKMTTTLPTRLRTANRDGVYRAGLAVATAVRAELGAAGVKGGRLRGVGTKGARIGVGFKAPHSLTNPQVIVAMRGPAHLLERDTKAHRIQPKRRRGASGRRAILTPAGPRAYANHPGTRGKHPFEKGVRRALPLVHREVAGGVRRALVETFR